MVRKLIDFMRNVFASAEKKLQMKTRELAMQTTQHFDNLQKIIKDCEYAMADHQKVINDREQFLHDNIETGFDQNVRRNGDNDRAYKLLTGVMLIGCIFSVKGLKFFFGEFYASMSLLMIIPVAMALAGVIVVGSIYLNNFSNRFRDQNPCVFCLIKAAAYAMVLFIPVMNLLEGIYSDYKPVVMALNLVGCAIDVILHTSLVSMSSVFTTAEDSKKAIKFMQLKDKSLATADQKLRAFNDTFMKAKTAFTYSAKQFTSSFKELQAVNATAASNTLFLLDNFTIWMINNKVMQHALIPYHTDENGHPVVELRYFALEKDSIRRAWDMFTTVRVENASNQQSETLINQRQVNELRSGDEDAQQQDEEVPIEVAPVYDPVNENTEKEPVVFDAMEENFNENEKVL